MGANADCLILSHALTQADQVGRLRIYGYEVEVTTMTFGYYDPQTGKRVLKDEVTK